jgi:sarcosine oxidase subunit beta
MDYVPESGVDGLYFRTERADQLVAGLHTDEMIKGAVSPDVALGSLEFDVLERLASALPRRLPGTETMSVGRSWTDIYPMSHADHRPVAGRHATADSVVCALGAGGTGIQLAPAVGRIAADAVLGRTSSFSAELDWSHARR